VVKEGKQGKSNNGSQTQGNNPNKQKATHDLMNVSFNEYTTYHYEMFNIYNKVEFT
jgi:hypothetical protein